MAQYADAHGVTMVQTEEHHGADNNWLPSPFDLRGRGASARPSRIAVTVSALIGPLHDPLRLAEDMAVLDLLSGGRLVTVAGIGYRPAGVRGSSASGLGPARRAPGRGTGDAC